MTEQEWLAATDPTPMLKVLLDGATDRKLLLFVAAAYRLVPVLPTTPASVRAGTDVETLLSYADGVAPHSELLRVWLPLLEPFASRWLERPAEWAAGFIWKCRNDVGYPLDEELPRLLRDIFRIHFRPVAVDPTWLTSTVVALAEGVYQECAFDR